MLSKDPCNALECAYQLRHEELFRECFVHVLGPWSKPRWIELGDSVLRDLAAKAQDKMGRRLYKFHVEMINIIGERGTTVFVHSARQAMSISQQVMMPKYLRGCNNQLSREEKIRVALNDVFASNITLDKNASEAGVGAFEDLFLCFEVEQLPWDTTQV